MVCREHLTNGPGRPVRPSGPGGPLSDSLKKTKGKKKTIIIMNYLGLSFSFEILLQQCCKMCCSVLQVFMKHTLLCCRIACACASWGDITGPFCESPAEYLN